MKIPSASPTYVFPVTNSISNAGTQFHTHASGQFAFHSPAQCQRHQYLHELAVAMRFAHHQRPVGRVHGLGASIPATGSISRPMPITPSPGPRQIRTSPSWTSTATSRASVRARRASSPLTRAWVCPPRQAVQVVYVPDDAGASLQFQQSAPPTTRWQRQRHAGRQRHYQRRPTGAPQHNFRRARPLTICSCRQASCSIL